MGFTETNELLLPKDQATFLQIPPHQIPIHPRFHMSNRVRVQYNLQLAVDQNHGREFIEMPVQHHRAIPVLEVVY